MMKINTFMEKLVNFNVFGTVVLVATSLCALNLRVQGAEANAEQNVPHKKLIELGWDIPTVDYIVKHWREMEANAPFDGIMYDLTGKTKDGQASGSQRLFSSEEWDRDSFCENVDKLNGCEFERFRENFIRIDFFPADFAWDDDASWAKVCEKAAICAWVARETKGEICLDFESYGEAIFHYEMTRDRSFEEAKALARRRGAEFCKAIVDEYPNVVLLCLWMNSCNLSYVHSMDPQTALLASHYGLLPAFIDGMLDASRPETVFVDGCENGYYMNSAAEYDRVASEIRSLTGGCVSLVSPENRSKYRAQVEAGFGFYLDMYSNPPGSIFYREAKPGETRFDRLTSNLRAAWNATDRYVWVYGEKNRWWAPENATSDDDWTSWEEVLPGLTEFQEELTDLSGFLTKIGDRLGADGTPNLLKNGDFTERGANGEFVGWSTWMLEETPGEFAAIDDKPAMRGVVNACYIQSIAVKPNERYFITGKIGRTDDMAAQLTARWTTAQGTWTSQDRDVAITVLGSSEPDENGRRDAYGIVEVPEDAGNLVLLLSARGPKGGRGVASFDDVRIYRYK